MEAEAEAVDGRLKEAEAKEKLTAVPSLVETIGTSSIFQYLSQNPLIFFFILKKSQIANPTRNP